LSAHAGLAARHVIVNAVTLATACRQAYGAVKLRERVMNEVQDELRTVVLWISEQTGGIMLPADLRARMALGCLDLAIEHQAGICALAEQALWGPVFALLQCMFDAFVRGVWLARCASEIELELFELAGLRAKPFRELVDEVERALGHSRGVLSKLRTSSWAMFSDFTRAGFEQVRRRSDSNNTGPNYSVAETDRALRLATALGLLSATELASLSGHRDVARACKERTAQFATHAAAH
jgi:hypothetical protein